MDYNFSGSKPEFGKKELPGGDPEPLEQLEFPIELKPDEDGLTEAWLFLLELVWIGGEGLPLVFTAPATAAETVVPVLAASDVDDDTDNEVLKWCLLPDRTKIIIKVKQ